MQFVDYSSNLLKNVHEVVSLPEPGDSFYAKGNYDYWHYGCDGFNDEGWGCGYRTLQTICSWIKKNAYFYRNESIPSIRKIQEILVNLEDKEPNFIGSKEWIGSFEVCLTLNSLYKIESKVLHIRDRKSFEKNENAFVSHFMDYGCPAMMGGDRDCSSKGVVGIHFGAKETYLLIVDPHFVGKAISAEQLRDENYVSWHKVSELNENSFYNICFPQVKLVAC